MNKFFCGAIILVVSLFSIDKVYSQNMYKKFRHERNKPQISIGNCTEAIQRASRLFENGMNVRALELSKKIYNESDVNKSNECMGLALQLQAMVLIKIKNNGKREGTLDDIIQMLKKSRNLLVGTPSEGQISGIDKLISELSEGNYFQSKKITKADELKLIKEKITEKGIGGLSEDEIKMMGPGARKLYNKMVQKNQSLYIVKPEAELVRSKDKMEQSDLIPNERKTNISQLLLKQKALIEGLSEEQARSALLITSQKALVDSFMYAALLDSANLVQQKATINFQKSALDLKESQKNIALLGVGLISLMAIGLFWTYKSEKKFSTVLKFKNEEIATQKAKSEELLLNILPLHVADELKDKGFASAKNYHNVTVMFIDFVDFTKMSELLTPSELVENLNFCFKEFDRIMIKWQLEKIKTIGDAYMAAGGLGDEDSGHEIRMVDAAKEIQKFMMSLRESKLSKNRISFQARIGIHSGPVTAGVVGLNKFAYDIWGDTVNLASRMESASEPDKINISESVYNAVKEKIACTPRGKQPVKNKVEHLMYFVKI